MDGGLVMVHGEESGAVRKTEEGGDVRARLLTLFAGVVLGVVLTLCAVTFFFVASGGSIVVNESPSFSLARTTQQTLEETQQIEKEKETHQEEKQHLETKEPTFSSVFIRAGETFTIVDIVNDLSRSDMDLIALFFFILVVVDLVWELMTEIFKHFLQKKHPHILTIVERMYLELAVVGLVSMVLFFLVTSGKFSDHVIHVFEFCHLALFGVTALFIFTMIFVSLLSIRIFKRWESLELVSVDSFKMKAALADIKGVPFYDVIHYYKKGQAKRLLHYWSLRRFFVERLNLDPTFPFDRYLKGCTKYLFSELAQVHWSTLAITVFGLLGLYYGFTAIDEYGPPLIIFSSIVFFLGCLIHWKSRKIFLQMVAQREKVLVFSKILDERAEKERFAEERGEEHMQGIEEMVRNSIEMERKSEDETQTTSDRVSADPLVGGEDVNENAFDLQRRRRLKLSVRRRKRVVDEEDASYLSYSDTASSTSGESYVSSSSSCYSDDGGNTTTRRRNYGERTDDEQDVPEDEGHHFRHVHHHHHHHHHVDLDEETRLAQSDLYFILHCCIPTLTCRMNPVQNFKTWARKVKHDRGHESLFWFRSPGFLLYLIQVLLFSQASQIVLAIVACAQVFPGVSPAYLPFAMLMGLINLFHLIPMIIYHFTIVVNVGVYTKKAVVRKVGKKSRHHRRLEAENEDYDPDFEFGGGDTISQNPEEREGGIEREESPKSLQKGEVEVEDVIPREEIEHEKNPKQRKKYHHVRRKKMEKKHEQGMVFKAHKEDDVEAFIENRGKDLGITLGDMTECFEHPEEQIENFSKYLQQSHALDPKKRERRSGLFQRKEKKKKPQVKMVELHARSAVVAPPNERPRTSLDGRPIEKQRSSLDRPSVDGERNFHYHHHGF